MLATKAHRRPIRLVIADRRPIVLQGFATLFAAERDFKIVASCLDGAACLQAVRKLTPDLALVEDGFSDVTASQMLVAVKAENIPTRLVFYTASVAHGELAAAIAAGACCAISMREKPKTLLQSLRLVAPMPNQATAGKEENGAFSENGLAALTDQERKIMRLVAYGMSNKQIARQLKVPTDTIKALVDRISTQLEIKRRPELAAFALSRLYGGIGALAALIFAALDDVKAASTTELDQTPTDTVTVMTADGTAITIKISAQKSTAAAGKAAKTPFKAGRVENSITETTGRASKPIGSSIDIAPGAITLPALNSARPGLGGYGTFMMTALGVWIYELLNSAAQASDLGNNLTALASAAESGASELVALNAPGSTDTYLDSFDNLAWLRPEIYHQSFSFETPGSDTIARNGDVLQIIGADPGEDSAGSNDNPHVGSGAVDALIDQGGFEQVAATDRLDDTEHDRTQPIAGNGSNPGQSQRGSHIAEDGGAAPKQHGEHGSPEDGSTYGQSQHDLKASKDDTVVATQHSKHDPPGDASNRAHSERDLHVSEDTSAAAEQHAKDHARPGSGANSGQSHRESDETPGNASGKLHPGLSQQHPGDKDQATDSSGQAQKTAAPELGDSFHFKNEIAASKTSNISDVHRGHGPDSIEYGLHTAGHSGLTTTQDADLIGPSHAEHIVVNPANGADHHQTHDLFV